MKKICITFSLIFIIFLATACDPAATKTENPPTTEYLRIHIRANSDDEKDQSVKYEIRDALVSALTPKIAECKDKAAAIRTVESEKGNLEYIANALLDEKGFDYSAKVVIREEEFPTRVYDGCSLPNGYYDAVIVELGKAEGKNWWCVVYPPLCFSSTENVTYKSKIAEIVRQFKQRYGV